MLEFSVLARKLAFEGLTYLGQVAPGAHAYGSRQAMHRTRAYHAAVLEPIAARGLPQEVLLLGHVHEKDGKVTRIEGFNGAEGQRWAERARVEIEKAGLLGEGVVFNATTPLRDCPVAWTQRAAGR